MGAGGKMEAAKVKLPILLQRIARKKQYAGA
jgi:hypothetical protein